MRILLLVIASLGLAASLWLSSFYWQSGPLASLVCVLIALAFGSGMVEQLKLLAKVDGFAGELDNAAPEVFDDNWLAGLQPSSQTYLRARLQGKTEPLIVSTLSPYISGLLVMLGLLGTFLGMVITLKGAVGAVQGEADILALRNSLALPLQGLGMAFGTSVAGVFTAALLGLCMTLVRRRGSQQVARVNAMLSRQLYGMSTEGRQVDLIQALLDEQRAARHDQQQYFALQGEQLRATEALLSGLQQMGADMQTAQADSFGRLQASLSDSLVGLQQTLRDDYQNLVTSVALEHKAVQQQVVAQGEGMFAAQRAWLSDSLQLQRDLQAELAASQLALIESMGPQLRDVMVSLEAQQAAFIGQLRAESSEAFQLLQSTYRTSLNEQQEKLEAGLSLQREGILQQQQLLTDWLAQQCDQQDRALNLQNDNLLERQQSLLDGIQTANQQAQQLLSNQQERIAEGFVALNQALQDRHEAWLATAGESERARAERLGDLVAQLATQVDHNQVAATQFAEMSQGFAGQVSENLKQLQGVSEHLSGGAQEVALLAETFAQGMNEYLQANQLLTEQLQALQGALQISCERADEQLAYYVDQARTLVEQTTESHLALLKHMSSVGA